MTGCHECGFSFLFIVKSHPFKIPSGFVEKVRAGSCLKLFLIDCRIRRPRDLWRAPTCHSSKILGGYHSDRPLNFPPPEKRQGIHNHARKVCHVSALNKRTDWKECKEKKYDKRQSGGSWGWFFYWLCIVALTERSSRDCYLFLFGNEPLWEFKFHCHLLGHFRST